jgi:hypothetical protein
MRKRLITAIVAGATSVFLATGAVDAASVHAGASASVRHGAMVGARASFVPPGFHHGRKVGFERRAVPPGWSHGRKVGWHHQSMPPGLR